MKLTRVAPFASAASLLAILLLAASPAALHAQTVTFSGVMRTLGSGFNWPEGVAVDGSGNVFVADYLNNEVKEIVAGGNFGPLNVGSSSATPLTLYFTFDTGGTLGSTAVLTKGAAGLDFTDAGGGTCTAGTAYSAGQICTVNVKLHAAGSGAALWRS